MAQKKSKAWTDWTWSPVIDCYAERLVAVRMSRNPKLPMYHGLASVTATGDPRWSREVRFLPERLAEPLRWKKPRKVFAGDMNDLFHSGVSNEQIAAVFGVMAATPHITYQVLTKRASRMVSWFSWVDRRAEDGLSIFPADTKAWRIRQMFRSYLGKLGIDLGRSSIHDGPWPLPNLWVGVTVEDQKQADERIALLQRVPARVHFLSCEPLLERVVLPMRSGSLGIDWVIIGGESGKEARPLDVAWARDMIHTCRTTGTFAFMNQCGSHVLWNGMSSPGEHWPSGTRTEDTMNGRGFRVQLRDRAGGDPSEWPSDLCVREFPEVTS